jgi:hypothetical protein
MWPAAVVRMLKFPFSRTGFVIYCDMKIAGL